MSRSSAENLLLTGPPGCGKTTVVGQVIERSDPRRLAGFYTREIRRAGRRVGFEAVGLGGRRAVLAHVDFRANKRVGRYGVELQEFETLVQAELGERGRETDLFVIDEIGRMECYSETFTQVAGKVLDGPAPVLATIALRGSGFIAEVKARPDVELLAVSPGNRDLLPAQLTQRLWHE